MKILVTGGTGQVGTATVDLLHRQGNEVRVITRSGGSGVAGVEYAICDTIDYPNLLKEMRGIEAIAHIAAVPRPSAASSARDLFHANVQGSFNIYEAAAEAGIKRVVCASSINALGALFSTRDVPLMYLPVDEDHPSHPSDPYAYSKNVMESMGPYFWQRDRISSATLRIPWVFNRNRESQDFVIRLAGETRDLVNRLMDKSAGERRQWVMNAMESFNKCRAARKFESEDSWQLSWSDNSPFDADTRIAMNGRYNLWTFIDVHDLADAISKALTGNFTGAHTVYVNHDRNWTGLPASTLIDLFHFDVPKIKPCPDGDSSLVSNAKARKLFGFEAPFSYIQ